MTVEPRYVYLVFYSYTYAERAEGKVQLGMFRAESSARQAIEKSRTMPGYSDHPGEYEITRYELDRVMPAGQRVQLEI